MFMFNFTSPVTRIEDIRNHEDMQSFIMSRSMDMTMHAIENGDLVYLEAARADAIKVFAATIEIIANRYDYLTWLSFMLYINRTSKLVALDASGDLMRCIELFEKLDAQTYYNTSVKSLFGAMTVAELKEGEAEVLKTFDAYIAEVRAKRGA